MTATTNASRFRGSHVAVAFAATSGGNSAIGVLAYRSESNVRKTGIVTASLLLATPLTVVAGQATATTPTCFGQAATITGSGIIAGTPDDDVIVGSAEADLIDGAGGNDRICGLTGSDTVEGGLGDDKVNGGLDDDLLVGDVYEEGAAAIGGGNDLILGGPGVDFIVGDSYAVGDIGNEVDATGGGDDVLRGGPDADAIIGDSNGENATGAGDDTVHSGPGVVTEDSLEVVVGDSRCSEACVGEGGDDSIQMGTDGGVWAAGDHMGSATGSIEGDGNDFIRGGVGHPDGEQLFGDSVDIGGSGVPNPAAGAGNDILRGRQGSDALLGQGGADRLNGGAEDDACDTEAGIDTAISCEILIVP